MSRRIAVLAGVVSLVLVIGACTKAAPEPIPTVTETETASAAPMPSASPSAPSDLVAAPAAKVAITELDAQATVKCVERGRPEIKVFYATKNATSVSFSPEPISWNSNKTSGTALMGFKCPRVHEENHVSQTYTLTATGADGKTVEQSKTVISKASPHLLGSTEGGDDMAGTS